MHTSSPIHRPAAILGCLFGLALASARPAQSATPEAWIVRDGAPQAQIVIAPERPRMVGLAALELQYYVAKISGARLPIVTEPAAGIPVNIYVGQSKSTDDLGITAAGLKYGAFRMVSGEKHLVLLGGDSDYQPPKPYPADRNQIETAEAEWDRITAKYTDSAWVMPWRSDFKSWWNPNTFNQIMADRYGADNQAIWNPKSLKWSRDYYAEGAGTGFWMQDEGGSLNAVYAFLRSLGVRWYMPGDLGEVIPIMRTIALPDVKETVKPDFAMRSWFWYNYAAFSYDHTIWARRLGMNASYEVLGNIGHAHGLTQIHGRKEMHAKHPEYYALYGGIRDTEHRGHGTACHSSAGLEKEVVHFARFLFDHYNQPHVSVFPSDGFKICGCELCAGKTASELVWGFADRIARELYKTHPDRIVSCGAYTSYVEPPDSIAKFSPNLAVLICNRARPLLTDPGRWEEYWSQIERWRKKLGPERLMRVENNRFTLADGKPIRFPALHPRAMAKDLQALKGICLGEYNEESQHKGMWKAPGLDHINLYVNARFLWDAGQDIEALLTEYFTQFYGPAAKEMEAAFNRAERDFVKLSLDTGSSLVQARINRLQAGVNFSAALHRALAAAGPDSVYGKRIQFILDELVPLDQQKSELETALTAPDPRQDAPLAVGLDADSPKEPATYELKDIVTGEPPAHKTTFQVRWDKDSLIFDVTCQEDDMPGLFVTDDIWGGDSVAVLLETPTHSYYQIEVNPDGAIFDADREGRVNAHWESQAQVKTEKGADYWRVTVSIPVMAPEDNEGDPFHYVVGAKPAADNLWYFNVGRVRVRNDQRVAQTFLPTGAGYHVREKFAKLAIE